MPPSAPPPQEQLQETVQVALQDPWPRAPEELKHHCAHIIGVLEKTVAHDTTAGPWVGSMLAALPHRSWWTLWMHQNARRGSPRATTQILIEQLPARLRHAYAHTNMLDDLLQDISPSTTCVHAILTAPLMGARPWLQNDPNDLLRFVHWMHNSPNLVQALVPTVVGFMWHGLLSERATTDTSALVDATHRLWSLIQSTDDTQSCRAWAALVTTLGHAPQMLEGYMGLADQPNYAKQALKMMMEYPPKHPVDTSVIAQLTEHADVLTNLHFLEHALATDNDPQWLATVVATTWDRAGLSLSYGCTRGPLTYASVMSCLAARGLMDAFTDHLTHITPTEALELAQRLAQTLGASTSAAVCALMDATPTSQRADVLGRFATQHLRGNPHFGTDQDWATRALIDALSLLPVPDAQDLLARGHGTLGNIPALALALERHVLTQAIRQPESTRPALKM